MNNKLPHLTSFSEKRRSEAMKKYEIIKPHILEQISIRHISKEKNIPIRTLQLWVQKYNNYGLKGLVRKERSDIGKLRISKEVTDEIERLILSNRRSSVTSTPEKFVNIASKRK